MIEESFLTLRAWRMIEGKECGYIAIRDRGKIKWQPPSFIPLGFEMSRAMFKDQERKMKPLLDDYEKEEFD
jgi:hypothetical protein